jgi:hypothetical protein
MEHGCGDVVSPRGEAFEGVERFAVHPNDDTSGRRRSTVEDSAACDVARRARGPARDDRP